MIVVVNIMQFEIKIQSLKSYQMFQVIEHPFLIRDAQDGKFSKKKVENFLKSSIVKNHCNGKFNSYKN